MNYLRDGRIRSKVKSEGGGNLKKVHKQNYIRESKLVQFGFCWIEINKIPLHQHTTNREKSLKALK